MIRKQGDHQEKPAETMRDLFIKEGTVVSTTGTFQADILILGGVISSIGRSLHVRDVPTVDARGRLVFPGIIDAHVQFEVSHGRTSMTDDFDTGTKAAACGGVTTIIDFADQPRGTEALSCLRERKAIADRKVNVDYSLHMSITDISGNTLRQIPTIVKQEFIPSFKLYLAYSRMERMVNEGEVFAVMRAVARESGIVGVHAESDALVEFLRKELIENGKTDPSYFAQSRPHVAEAISVASAIGLARAISCDLYVHHVSTALAIDLIAEAKKSGARVWAETCPQYLVLTDAVYASDGRHLYVMNPPLRGEKDRERLWKAVATGEIDTIATDHCSYMTEQKLQSPRFDRIPPGLPGVETLLPLTFSEGVIKRRITLSRLAELLCLNPARIFGLTPRKGAVTVGGDGDLVIFNPDLEWTLRAQDLHTNVDFCPFEGMRVTGRVEKTILRGEIVYDGHRFCGTRNGGKFIPGKR